MKRYYRLEIGTTSPAESDLLVGELSGIGFYAFEELGPVLYAYVEEEDYDEEALKTVLPAILPVKTVIEDRNWNAEWEKSIQTVVVHDFAAIRPSFHGAPGQVRHDLIITPKMSFGTGHHATTFLMVEMMEGIDFKNKSVIDFGTGTGVLAILSEKCGASQVIAVDKDPWSIENVLENMVANGCSHIVVEKRDHLPAGQTADVVLANIDLATLKQSAGAISGALKPGAFLLTSGYLVKDTGALQNIFAEKNVVQRQMKQSGEWIAVLYQKCS